MGVLATPYILLFYKKNVNICYKEKKRTYLVFDQVMSSPWITSKDASCEFDHSDWLVPNSHGAGKE